MVCAWILIIAVCLLLHWLYGINKSYYIMAFFARRARTKDGRPVDSIVPVLKGRTIFGNSFDLFGKDDAGVFQYSRSIAKEKGSSYLTYTLGWPVYNIIDPENAEFVLNNESILTKSVIYTFLQPALNTGLLTALVEKWHIRRKMILPTFHYKVLGQFMEIFKTESLKFVHQLGSEQESIISLSELIPRFTLNSVCETAMGVKLDDMTEKGDRYRESVKMIEKLFVKRLSNSLLHNDHIYNLFAASKDAPYLKVVHEFTSEIIAKRRILLEAELDHRRNNQLADDDIYINTRPCFAMLDTLICAEKDGLIDHEGICEEVDTLMFGGFDTTSVGLIFTLMNMSLYLDKQAMCYKELTEHIEGDLSNLNMNQLAKLKYLDCFINETLRLYAPIPIMGRQTSSETELPNGLILPALSQIAVHVFDIHRNPKYWDTPDEFDPDRFLPENCNNRHPFAFIPFGAGPRNCIGQKFALLEIKTLIIFILKQFKILPLVDPKELIAHCGITLGIKNNIKIKLVRRN